MYQVGILILRLRQILMFYKPFAVVPTFILSTSVGDMIKYENYITFLRLLPDFNLCHQLRIINERFVNNHAQHIPEEIRNELNSKTFLQLGSFYYYVFLMFPLLTVRYLRLCSCLKV